MPRYGRRRRYTGTSSYPRSRRNRRYSSYESNSSYGSSRYSSSSRRSYTSTYYSYGPSRNRDYSYNRDDIAFLKELKEKLEERKREEKEKEKREEKLRKLKEKQEKERKERERREAERERRERDKREEAERREREDKEKEAREEAERVRRQIERLERGRRLRREREEKEKKEEEERLRKEEEEREKREKEAREKAERERAERTKKRPVGVVDVDLHIQENAKEHHTDKYDLTQKEKNAEPVIRRGQPFLMDVSFDRPYKNEHHDLRIVLRIGNIAETGNGVQSFMRLKEDGEKPSGTDKWHARLIKNEKNTIYIEVQLPNDCIVGEWSLSIDTRVQGSGDRYDRYDHPVDINVIMNPWCKDDTVFMHEKDRDGAGLNEYVLNDRGAVFRGSYASPWFFAQFEEGILEVCFQLLRNGNKSKYTRALGDPVEIARQLTYLINNKVLEGNWSGDYEGGEKPTHWKGSDAILERYAEKGKIVKFGQCWVFSAVTVTVCRALGIPCKSVTCIGSAHDTDDSTCIDEYYVENEEGDMEKSKYYTSDSIWNFHVWNEIFVKRSDLHDRTFDGWQVIDATPQEETSESLFKGAYACGPASVMAIKKGLCNRGFDAKFIFAEVNADVAKWKKKGGSWEIFGIDSKKVGKRVLSKCPDGKGMRYYPLSKHDVTSHYKFPEGTPENKKAVLNAGLASNIYRTRGYAEHDENEKKDLEITMRDINQDGGKVLMGQDFNIFLDLENKSHRAIKANVSVSLSIQTYTGDNLATYLREEFKGIMISGNTVKALKVNVKADRYLRHLTRDGQGDNDLDGDMEAVIIANFDDHYGDHDFVHLVEQFRVGWADLKLKAPEKVAMGAPFDVTLSFTEDVPMALTNCKLNWEGAGFTKVENYDIPNITDAKNWSHKITVKPKKRNPDGELIVSLDCKELPDITGTLDIAVF